MFCTKYTVNLTKKDDVIHLRPIGDIHIGHIGCDKKEYERQVNYIADHPDYITIGMGDYIDNVQAYANGMVDKRWSVDTVDPELNTQTKQINYWTETWKPISRKCTGLHAGNHEWKTIDQLTFKNRFCDIFGLSYLGRIAYTHLQFKHKKEIVRDYIMLTMHGGYAGPKTGGVINKVEDIINSFDCDVAMMGHTHDTWTTSKYRMYYDDSKKTFVERKILLANTGTFLRGYVDGVDGYIESNPKPAKRVGTITITFDPYKGTLYGHD